MKKFFTLVAFALSSLTMMATDYQDNLKIVINGKTVSEDKSTINVDKQDDGKYTLSLKNFQFKLEGVNTKVGNIVLKDVDAVGNGVTTMLKTSQKIKITKGDGIGWLGPALGNVPVNMIGELRDGSFYTTISIYMATLKQNIEVTFGTAGYQIPNSDFEAFHNEKGQTTKLKEGSEDDYDYIDFDIPEPNHWHSFGSASGDLVGVVKMNKQSDMSEDVREGSTGKKCVKVVSALEFSYIPANGTLTTGQLQASGMSPESTDNCAFLDLTNEDKDANGDPFYVTLTSKPDAIKFWARFKQGTLEDPSNKYASVNAVITDGTRFQDPQDKEYTNIVAMATNKKIESKDFTWQEVTVPFDYKTYADNNVMPKAILVTLSTNSVPGAASTDAANPDELYIDDLSLVYNAGIKSVKVKGTELTDEAGDHIYRTSVNGAITASDVVVESDGAGAYITKTFTEENGGVTVDVTITSNDLKTENTYKIYITGATSGINHTTVNLPNGIQAIYNLAGQQVSSMTSGNVYIVKTTDGKTKKVIKK